MPRIALASAIAIFIASLHCSMPGATLGIYSVSGTLTTNTCGVGLEAPSPWKFNVELSETSTLLYWNAMDGSSLLSGERSGTTVTLGASASGNVDGVDGGTGPCNMTRSDTLALALSGEATPKSFTGTLTYSFSVDPGSSCGDQLSSAGGIYDALPCTVSYALSGSHQ